jgi:hypothetical protein
MSAGALRPADPLPVLFVGGASKSLILGPAVAAANESDDLVMPTSNRETEPADLVRGGRSGKKKMDWVAGRSGNIVDSELCPTVTAGGLHGDDV